ncbi:MAG: HAD hydrolase-like protein [Verrucomicrobia bacterium]|nr:HAD hydrolase-like protein [Verrucomicrobiota bacterium]
MKIELVVFDMAGTTVRDDDSVNRCLRDALAAGGLAVSRDEVNAVMGIPKPDAIAALLAQKQPASAPPSAARVAELHNDFLRRMLDFYRTDPSVGPMPGTLKCFAELRRRSVRLALDTGFSRDIVDTILQRLGWNAPGFLDATVASDEVPRGRPHPDLLIEAMRRTGVASASQVAKVGDTPSDLQEGTAAGCGLVIGVTNGTHTREQLASHPHHHLICSLAELPALLD